MQTDLFSGNGNSKSPSLRDHRLQGVFSLPTINITGMVSGIATAVPIMIGINKTTKWTQDHEQKEKDVGRRQQIHVTANAPPAG